MNRVPAPALLLGSLLCASLCLTSVGCKRSGDSKSPKNLRTAIEPGLMKEGYTVPRVFADTLAPGTVINALDESVVCSAEEYKGEAGGGDSIDLAGKPYKFGSTLLGRLREHAGAGESLQGVDVDISAASVDSLASAGDSPAAPGDAGCAGKVVSMQNEGKPVMVVTAAVRADVSFTAIGGGLDGDKLGEALGVTLSAGEGSMSGSGAGLILAYKASELPPPNVCQAEAPCTSARRVDGECRCLSCAKDINTWASETGATGTARGVSIAKDAGFDLLCKNMPAGALEVRAQGMFTSGIIEEDASKTSSAWWGCLELHDRNAGESVAKGCADQIEAGAEHYLNLTLPEGGSVQRSEAGDVHVEVRNLGTKLGQQDGGPANLHNFTIQIRAAPAPAN